MPLNLKEIVICLGNEFRIASRITTERWRRRRGTRAMRAESLEPRMVLATAYVLNNADAGGGSFRQAIIDANNHPGPDRIDFSLLAGSGVRTISLFSPLPQVAEAVIIDGATVPDYSGSPLIELSGNLAGAGTDGLVIAAGPTTVRGLAVNGFLGAGMLLQSGTGIALVGNVIGTDPTGTIGKPNAGPGIKIQSGVNYSVIGMQSDWKGLQDPPTTQTFGTAPNPHAISTADVDNDGLLDLVTANFGGSVSVALNHAGSFGPAINYPTAGAVTDGVAIADVNGDGKLDIAASNRDTNNISILLNNGNSTFAAPITYAAGFAPHSVNVADLDSDGDKDLAVVSRDSADVTILLNNGFGVYSAPTSYPVGNFPFESAIADFNGDGLLDIAVDNAGSNTASVLLNLGNGTFASKVDYAVGSGPHSIVSADFDGDGKTDLATADNFSSTVSILRNNGNGTFASAVSFPVPTPVDITALDINGDGSLDLATADNADNSTSILINDGVGGFGLLTRWDATGSPRAITGGDFDADGNMDVAITQFGSGDVRVYRNLGSTSGGNRVAANLSDGIRLEGSHVVVAQNSIGAFGLGNGRNGVSIESNAVKNTVGLRGQSNRIVANHDSGIVVTGAFTAGNTLRFNELEGNALGIDLGGDGVTPNDPMDADGGPNLMQNTMILTRADPGSSTRVFGSIETTPFTLLRLDVYTTNPYASGIGQGQRYLGTIQVMTDVVGRADVDAFVAGATLPGEAVTATITAPDGSTSEFSSWVLVASANHSPVATVSGPVLAVPGQPLTYTFAATDPDGTDYAAGFGYLINFGDGTTPQLVAPTVNNGSGVSVKHTYTTTGSFLISASATDQHGMTSDPIALVLNVETALLIPDPLDSRKTLLAIGGTTGDDKIKVKPGRDCGEIKVVIRDEERVVFYRHTFDPPVGRISVYGQAGDDDIMVHPDITIAAWLYGNDGNDRLKGGGGHSMLLGGAGDDLLVGAAGRDLLIGGVGADKIIGDEGDDILISGNSSYDFKDGALAAILAEWTSARSYLVRVANLQGLGTGPRENNLNFLIADGANATVFDDGDRDILTGGTGLDWFMCNIDGDGDRNKKDKVTDLNAAEFLTDLAFIAGNLL